MPQRDQQRIGSGRSEAVERADPSTVLEACEAAVDLADAAETAWAAAETPGADLLIVDEPPVRADAGQLRHLLTNLFRNAVEHGSTSPHSQARGDAAEHAAAPDAGPGEPAVTVRVGATDEGYSIEDDGPGIPEGEREAVFASGHSGDGGTGYGLTIVGRIAELHGWAVAVTDGDTGGARFVVRTD